ncbi:MAG: DegT/DnrJ/EryC1/StrS family aminotransferase [Thalassotalea sp.]|nr:DegT/DnrJ/EryC1/StrS family aminotransferase [Thalassotalea sp.]
MKTNKIIYPIVKPVLPTKSIYFDKVNDIYDRCWLTNNGPLLQELECKLSEYLNVENLMLVSNGTLALHLAYRALNIQGKVITTPFSFAATASSICWENNQPLFNDINERSLNIEPSIIKNNEAKSIVAVHVFGNPCEVEQIEKIAKENNQTVIYDAAHAFGVKYKGNSIFNFGDASTLSLHATKLFHSVEGGAIVFKKQENMEMAKQLINFGFDENNIPSQIGINAKMSEFHAAMGLAVFDMIEDIIDHRKVLAFEYIKHLTGVVELQGWHCESENNGAYMPVLLKSEKELLDVQIALTLKGIQTRRYFYPSLSTVDIYGKRGSTPIANSISLRVLCLPMYFDLSISDVSYICNALKLAMNK